MHKLFKFQNLALLIGLDIFATIAQLAITKAYRVGKALINGTYSYLTIVFSSVWGFLFLGELMDLLTIFGIALVIFAGLKVRA
jgi:drug/metabolite transporter (DMT)-like permease